MRGLIVLLVVFVVMAAALYFQERDLEEDAAATPVPTPYLQRVFPDMEVLRLQAVQLLDPNTGDDLILARGETGAWTAPGIEGTLDTDAATAIARTIILLPYMDTFTLEDDNNLSAYGFGYFNIQFITVEAEEHVVAIGNPAPHLVAGQPAFYALVDDRPEVYLVQRGAISFLIDQFMNPPIQ